MTPGCMIEPIAAGLDLDTEPQPILQLMITGAECPLCLPLKMVAETGGTTQLAAVEMVSTSKRPATPANWTRSSAAVPLGLPASDTCELQTTMAEEVSCCDDAMGDGVTGNGATSRLLCDKVPPLITEELLSCVLHTAHVGQPAPKTPSEASYEARNNEPEECLGSTMAGRSRALFVTKRHKTSLLGLLLAISEVGWTAPPDEERFFRNNFFCGNFVLQKNWNLHQPRLGITPLARFRGPIARFGANSLPGPLPLGR